MDCSAFRRHHLAYVDDTLPGELLVAAVRHAAECPACARHDTAVRRSLLLARNLAPLECSPDFAARLDARIQAAIAAEPGGPAGRNATWRAHDDGTPSWWELTSARMRTRQVAAAAAMVAAVSAGAALGWQRDPQFGGIGAGTAAAFVTPFAAPFATPVSAASLGESAVGAASAATADEMTFVVYDGATGAVVDAATLVAPAATGVPVWAAAMLAGEVPSAVWNGSAAPAFQLVSDPR